MISTNRNRLPMPVMPVGACLVAAAARQHGHDVDLLDLMFARTPLSRIAEAIACGAPGVVGISVRNIDNCQMTGTASSMEELVSVVAEIRAHTSALVVLGGAAPAMMPEQILRLTAADCAVTTAAETVFPLLLERIAHGRDWRIPGVAWIEQGRFRQMPVETHLPLGPAAPAYPRWIDVKKYSQMLATAPLQTKVGCQFCCTYCSYPSIEGKTFRCRPAAEIADKVSELAASGLTDVEIVDSVFNAPYEHALEVSSLLARSRHNARLHCLELTPLGLDDQLLNIMEQAGFCSIGITAESASDQVLVGLGKPFGSSEVHHAADAVRRHNIPCAWIFLLGGPGETPATVRETLAFAERYVRNQDLALFNIGIRIYPETKLEGIARAEGILNTPAAGMLAPLFYVSPQVEAQWIAAELGKLKARRMNFIDMETLSLPFLPTMNRMAASVGLRPPLWKHTRLIRSSLRFAGMDV